MRLQDVIDKALAIMPLGLILGAMMLLMPVLRTFGILAVLGALGVAWVLGRRLYNFAGLDINRAPTQGEVDAAIAKYDPDGPRSEPRPALARPERGVASVASLVMLFGADVLAWLREGTHLLEARMRLAARDLDRYSRG